LKRFFAGLVLAVSLAACGGGGGGASTVVVYNGQHLELTRLIVAAFERETGIHVRLRSGDSLVVATQVLQEGSASPADVILSENSPELVKLEQRGRLRQLPSKILGQVPAGFSSADGRWVGAALRVSSLAYDPARIARSQLPRSILDLAQPGWKGKVAIAPTDSDFPPLVGAVVAHYGADRATAWLEGLKRNASIYQDEEAVVAAVNRGSAAAGLVNAYYWYRLRLEIGAGRIHSALHYFPPPDVGSIVNVAGAALLATSKHADAAERFVAFLVGAAGQRIIARSDDFEYPARPGIAANATLPPFAETPHATVPMGALGDGSTAARLIRGAGLA
jgi:iron(III) transport system substrate-binding protein